MSEHGADRGLEAVAIVGMSCRFPGAAGIEEFWRNLLEGVESIRLFGRRELAEAGVPRSLLEDPSYVPASGVLDGSDLFDAGFFGFSPRMAEATDPQHRLFLECAWEALERAGYDSAAYRGAIGLFAGVSMNTYLLSRAAHQDQLLGAVGGLQAAIGNRTDHLTTMVAYKLNLRGPAVTVQTTCSTSLVAVHLACQSLLDYQCSMALAGGVRVAVPMTSGYLYGPGGILSPDGHCRPFDAGAQGTIVGSGAGVVVLKRLADALKDGDEIHAVIRGTAVNNDGSVKAGYTAPSAEGQAKVIATAQAVAGVHPEEIGYVEAHGTGTPLGDPIELSALTRVFRAKTGRRGFCALGAVKSNFGHLDTAAGIASLIKTALVLRHGQIPPTLHFERPNPELRLEESPFYVPASVTEWPPDGGPRRAGVSAFGIGGTNAHAILEEAPQAVPSGPSREVQLLLLSARTSAALEAATANLRRHLETETGQNLADVAHTLRVGRRPFEIRRAVACRDRAEAIELLGSLEPGRVYTSLQEPRQRPVIFLFPGQGAQRARMGAEVYDSEETFRREVDRCCAALEPWLGLDLRRELLAPEAESRLDETFLTQPALFVVEYALARLWMSWGISPQAMIGHSLGEYVAACLAGVFSLEDALRLVAGRGQLMQELPPGAMLSVQLSEEELRQRLGEPLSLAAVNRPSLCVVSGPVEEVDHLERQLSAEGVACRRLRTTRAFHSSLVEPILPRFAGQLAGIELKPPAIPFVSNLTGRWIQPEEATDPGYWVRHLRSAVRFSDGVGELLRQGEGVLLEVGPGRTLRSFVRQHPAWTVDHLVFSSLQHDRQEEADSTSLPTALGRLWISGTPIDWRAFQGGERRRRVVLPTYPFERRRYWFEPKAGGAGASIAMQGEWKEDPSDWFWLPSWRRTTPPGLLRPEPLEPGRRWLVFTDEAGLGDAVSTRLEQLGQEVVRAAAGEGFSRGERGYTLSPGRPEDYRALIDDLRGSGRMPHRIVHLWCVDAAGNGAPAAPGRDLERGFFSLLFLGQALGTGEGEPPLRLDVVSTGLHEVTGGDLRSPEKAALLGPCKVLPKESLNLDCRSIDLPGAEEVEPLLTELLAGGSERMVAHRGGHRWVQSFEPVRLERAEAGAGLRPGGVYLVTGGFGGMGMALAEHLARTCAAKLILTGRSPLPPREDWEGWLALYGEEDPASRRILKVRTLEEAGAEVLAASVDVADREGMHRVLTEARRRFGPVNGVFHTAGISPGGLAQLKTADAALRTLAPKLEGTRVLASLLAGEDLDFFLLCSSRSAIFGPPGAIDYTAANAFQDAFAHAARTAGLPRAVSINWCGWEEVGMMAEAARDRLRREAREDGEPVAHPLFDRRRVEPGREIYLTEFSARTRWVLNEHRIVGNPVVPGTAYLEMARAAAARRGLERIELRDVFFLTPLRLREDESREMRFTVEETDGRIEFQAASRPYGGSGDWQKHVLGRILPLAPGEPERRDLAEIRRRCAVEDLIATQEEQNEDLGPRWQNVIRVHVGDGEVLAALELPEAFAGDLASCALHPALLDRAASIGDGYLSGQDSYLPFSYQSLRLLSPLPRKIYSHARLTNQEQSRGETLSFDVDLLDESGNVLVAVRSYHKKRVNDAVEKLRLPEAGLARTSGAEDPGEWEAPAEPAARTGVSPAEGIEVFCRILARPWAPQIVVSPNDLLAAVAAAEEDRPLQLGEEAQQGASEASEPRHDRPDLSAAYAPAGTALQARLAGIWSELLGFRDVGIHDNFFELGGDSVLAIQILSRARKAGIEISPGEIFEHQTIAELAAHLERSGSQPGGGELPAPPIVPVPRDGALPLSFAQERLWFLARLEPDSPTYNMPSAVRIAGRLDLASLAASLRAIVRRHEVLRTCFAEVEGRPVQLVASTGWPEISLVDLGGLEEERREAVLRSLIEEQSARPFDLTRAPLLRMALFRLGGEEHLALTTLHHTVADGWSLGLFLNELEQHYAARTTGRPPRLRTLPVQYADYAAWQRSWLSGEVLERKLAFWRQHLAGVPPVLDLSDRPRPARKGFQAGTCSFCIPAALAAEFASVGREREATLFMTLLAAFETLLSRYSGRDDLVIGTPVANRDRPEIEGLIGMFVNTLALRADLKGDPAFLDLLERVRRQMPEVHANQDLPFEKLVNSLDLPRSLGHAPLVQVMLTLRNYAPVEHVALQGLAFEPLLVEAPGLQFDLTLVAAGGGEDDLRCLLEYDADLFDASTIQRMAGHLVELVRGIGADPQRRLSELPLLTAAELHHLLAESNDTERAGEPGLLPDLIAAMAARVPAAPAVLSAGERLTYGDLDHRSNRVARRLARLGVGPDVRVGLCLERSPDWLVCALGILKAGGAYLPLSSTDPGERIAWILKDAGAAVLISRERLTGGLDLPGVLRLCLDRDREALAGEPVEALQREHDPASLAYVLYTSGSTGRPKGVAVHHRGLACYLRWIGGVLEQTGVRTLPAISPLTFDASLKQIFSPLLRGEAVRLLGDEEALDPGAVRAALAGDGHAAINCVPAVLEALLSGWPAEGIALRAILLGGEALGRGLADRLFERMPGVELWNLYGPTEVTSNALAGRVAPGEEPSVGRPIDGIRAHVLDRGLRPVPLGALGQLHLAGAGVARGYLGRPDLTAAAFVPDPFAAEPGGRLYATGDLVRRLPDGRLRFAGRADGQIKVRGVRIEPGEIEAALAAHPDVREAAVVAWDAGAGGRQLAAYVGCNPETAPAPGELRSFLQGMLPDPMIPAVFVPLAVLPRNANGKLDRAALPAPGRIAVAAAPFSPPETPAEQALAAIWAEVLRRDRVGVQDNFFELGGDSIMSIQVVARAARAGIRITPRQMFSHQTIAELAAVAEVTAGTAAATAPQRPVTGPVRLTPAQLWFFDAHRLAPHHHNQAVLLAPREPLSPAVAERAFAALLAHHDALRLRFAGDLGAWRAWNEGPDGTLPWSHLDLSGLPPEQGTAACEHAAAQVQASLDLSAGPLLRGVWLGLAQGQARLLLVVHHLAVDGVSWRILLEDLDTVCRQLRGGEAVSLPPKTTSFQQWAERLAEHAHGPALEPELPWWRHEAEAPSSRLPVDRPGTESTQASVRRVSVSLDADETRALLQEVPAAYRTQINDILLTALARALAGPGEALLVQLEGHGREELFDGVDLSRTVGWFTSFFPVRLAAGPEGDPGAALQGIKEHLRAIPRRGIGFGMLRWLRGDEAATAELRSLPQPDVTFNYLGQFDGTVSESSLFAVAGESTGPSRSPREIRRDLLTVDSLVAGGRLQADWTYSANLHERSTVEGWAAAFLARLRELIEHCRDRTARRAGSYTPSDFPLARLGAAELDRLLGSEWRIADVYPLSPLQEGILFHSLYAPGSGVYVEQLVCTLCGDHDAVVLEEACRRIVERHPVLRTSFHWQGLERALQVVHGEVPVELERDDWRALPADERERLLEDLLRSDRARGFDLARAPVMRWRLLRTAESEHLLVWSHHHVLLDGWSLSMLAGELLSCYAALRAGSEPALPRRRPYGDYIAWLLDRDLSAAEEHWRRTLAGWSEPTPLAVDRRSDGEARGMDHRETRLGVAATAALEARARGCQVTLNTLVQAAWALLLAHYSGRSEVVFGSTVSGRPPELPDSDSMVGLFINTLPVRVRVEDEIPLAPWLRGLQLQQSELRQHEHSPLVKVHEWSEVPRGLPLFESILVFENYPPDRTVEQEGSGLGVTAARTVEQTHYPVTLMTGPGADLRLYIGFDLSRLDAVTVERMLGHLSTLLAGISAAAERRPSELPLLTEAERQQALGEWTDTRARETEHRLLHEILAGQAASAPESVAVAFRGASLTYGELDRLSNRLARHLVAAGVRPDEAVPLLATRGPGFLTAVLGLFKAGGAYLPLDPLHPPLRLSRILEESGARLILAERQLVPALPEGRPRLLILEDLLEESPDVPLPAAPGHLAYLMYTSGSTGTPKGVMVEHRGMLNHLLAKVEALGLTAADVVAQTASQCFDISVWQFLAALLVGGRIEVFPDEIAQDPPRLLAEAERAGVTVLQTVPSLLRLALDALEEREGVPALKRLRWLISTGEALPADLCRRWLELYPDIPLLNGYGPTECSDNVTHGLVAVPPEPGETSVPIGRPVRGLRLYVLRHGVEPVPAGVPGELYVGGVGVGRGYHRDGGRTAEAWRPDPFAGEPGARLYRTGDLARQRTGGALEFLGRIDHQVKIRGLRIELGEIEAVLVGHPEVRAAVVTVREDRPGQPRLVAYAVPRRQEGFARQGEGAGDGIPGGLLPRLRTFAAERLPEWMVPSAWMLLEELPLTPNRKVDRKALPAPEPVRPTAGEHAAPRGPAEETLAAIWAAVLGLERVGAHDDFFALGGHSLLATRVVSRLRDAFGVELPLRILFEEPTVARLAARIGRERGNGGTAQTPPLRPVPRDGGLPLSFAQQRLWFLAQLEPGDTSYNMPFQIRLHGPLDLGALARSLGELFRRHEVLRTTFTTEAGSPVQVIGPPAPAALPRIDLSALPEPDREREMRRISAGEAARPFDLSRGPLLRVQVVQLAPGDHLALLNAHHIALDAWSRTLLFDELSALYSACREGRPSPLPDLAVQYADFAVWQRRWLTGETLAAQAAYWRERLGGDPPPLELPTDRPRPPVEDHRGGTHGLGLSPALTRSLAELGRREGATLFMVLLAAFQALLGRYSGQEDVVVGAPVSGRGNPETEGLIGLFLNTLPLRLSLAGNPSFRELLGRAREVSLDAYAHQHLPFEKLVEVLQPRRDLSRHPIFDVMVNLINTPRAQSEAADLTLRFEPLAAVSGAKLALTLHAEEIGDRLFFNLNYQTALFTPERAAAILSQLAWLLEQIAAEPGLPLSACSLVTPEARQWLPDPALPLSETIYPPVPSLVRERASQAPLDPAVRQGGQTWTYGELVESASNLACHLAAGAARRGETVAVSGPPSFGLVAALLGVLQSGGVMLTLDPALPAARRLAMARIAGVRRLLHVDVSPAAPESFPGVEILRVDPASGLLEGGGDPRDPAGPPLPQPDDPAYVFFTSGSSGEPKGILGRHKGVSHFLDWQRRTFEVGPGDRCSQLTSLSFDALLRDVFLPLVSGATLCLPAAAGLPAAQVVPWLESEGITLIHTLPAVAQTLIGSVDRPVPLPRLRRVFFSGEPLTEGLVRRWRHAFPGEAVLVNLYGPTETTMTKCFFVVPAEPAPGTQPLGHPLPETQALVLRAENRLCGISEAGEIVLRTPFRTLGYLNAPEEDRARFAANPFRDDPADLLYRTGDRGRYRPDGGLEILGRLDEQVKVRGVRVEPGEIEAALLRHKAVASAAVVARRDSSGEVRLAAYLACGEGRNPTVGELRESLRQELPEPLIPSAWVILDALPLTATGKVDRHALPDPEAPEPAQAGFVTPRTATEKAVAGIWQEVLQLDRVGLHDNFFDLGGHSLRLIEVHSRLVRRVQGEIPLVELFRHPTVSALAQYLESRAQGASAPSARKERRRARGTAESPSIAIIGMGGRFPGAADVGQLWRNLCDGRESISFFTDEELLAAGVDPATLASPRYVKAGSRIDGVDQLDAAFFGFSPREAEILDPQHRLLLECAWEVLERAGYDSRRYPDPIGVYAGVHRSTYLLNLYSHPELVRAVGDGLLKQTTDKDYLTTRISYKLGLRGPSFAVQTTCSTSLVAVHLACQALLAGECRMALAGGVSVRVPQERGYLYDEGDILSPDGHCRSFDAAGRGTLFTNGLGLVLLKRLEDALADRDTIHAVIRGTAINNDGDGKVGYTAPGIDGQAEVISAAQDAAGVEPETVTYVEGHGTATALGDPVEVAALTRAFRDGGATRKGFCALGSVKANVGHLDTAAGVTGLIKTALALEHRLIPPSLHFERANPNIDFESSPFYVNTTLTEWQTGGEPRRAGVSSFGIGGTNAHAVLEEAPPAEPSGPSRPWQLLLLSARTPAALEAATARLADHLESHPEVELADAAYTLQIGRRTFEHRRAIVCRDREDAAAALRSPERWTAGSGDAGGRPVAFLFPGQGAQYAGMGRGLYEAEPTFRETVDSCAVLLEAHLGLDLRRLLFPPEGESAAAGRTLTETRFAQPALFVVEYALARLWMEWGIRPTAMIGHSLGEYVAACLAGVFSLPDALHLVAARGRLMQQLPPGAMLAVSLPEQELRGLLGEAAPSLSLAAVNAPALGSVSGPLAAIEAFAALLTERGIEHRRLHTSHAFHSAMMEPALRPFAELVATIDLQPPRLRYLSNLTGTWVRASEATDPGYWARHLREPVRFSAGLSTLLSEPELALLEAGPGRSLATLAQQHGGAGRPVIRSLRHPREEGGDPAFLLGALGRLWLVGVEPDWAGFSARERRRRVPLPTYPFERQRFWVDRAGSGLARILDAPPPERAESLADLRGRLTNPQSAELLERLLALEPGLRVVLPPAPEAGAAPGPGAPTAPAEVLAGHRRPDLPSPWQAPRNGLERQIAAVWEEILGIDGIGVHDDFFELGGHSLLATRLASRLRQAFGRELPLDSLFAGPTIAQLAARLESEELAVSALPPIERVSREGALPLSFAQQRLLFLHVLAPGDVSYNMPLTLRLRGSLEPARLRGALCGLVARHEVLRTTFSLADQQPVQHIAPAATAGLPLLDLSGLPAAPAEREAQRLAGEEARRPFDLFHGPVLRAALLRLQPGEHVLLVDIHHIAVDGWSWGVFYRELAELYEKGEQAGLPELPVQYADFAAWQRRWLQGEALTRQLEYWRERLAGLPPVELPADHARPAVRSGRGAVLPLSIPGELAEALRGLGRQEDATLFMTLLAAFFVLLRSCTRRDVLSVGTDIANRTRAELEGLMGLFVNQLVLRCDLPGDPTFREVLRRVRRETLEAYAHQDAPFDRLVEILNPVRDMSRTPLFQVKLVLQNTPFDAQPLRDLSIAPFEVPRTTVKFDLLLNLLEGKTGIVGRAEYSTDIFAAPSIARLLDGFAVILRTVSERPDARLGEIEAVLAGIEAQEEEELDKERRSVSLARARRQAVVAQPAS
ncbi:MAG TPA: amino acid adenylation domain-containing protein [Thermoanaerobaculia bacterium]|nr:amino acid adenylation domain-containing protein [Thermoanaerobaculia bacterium]